MCRWLKSRRFISYSAFIIWNSSVADWRWLQPSPQEAPKVYYCCLGIRKVIIAAMSEEMMTLAPSSKQTNDYLACLLCTVNRLHSFTYYV